MSGLLIVLSAPSGAGKSSVIRALMRRNPGEYLYSISATTRPRRNGEENGRDYFFLSETEFTQKIKNHEFVEWANVHGYYYGTLRAALEAQIAAGKRIVFDLDVKGGLALKEKYPANSILVFIAPPSKEALIQRLRERGTETDEMIARRLRRYSLEMARAKCYDHVVINDVLERVVEEIATVIQNFKPKASNS
ncbi:guanylate kinase [candidate division KSB1 bacterium]|nr:guanylate kinase [candidate division KSB1 bacterium]